jgi:hypothetical protein
VSIHGVSECRDRVSLATRAASWPPPGQFSASWPMGYMRRPSAQCLTPDPAVDRSPAARALRSPRRGRCRVVACVLTTAAKHDLGFVSVLVMLAEGEP